MPWLAAGNRVWSVSRLVHSYEDPERFVAGTVGEPGARTFFLQARDGSRITSIACEEELRAGTMTLAWEADAERVVIEVFAAVPEAPEPEEEPDLTTLENGDGEVFVVSITEEQARAFARRAVALVAAGRPSCPFCGRPIDPQGHICARANGYRRHT